MQSHLNEFLVYQRKRKNNKFLFSTLVVLSFFAVGIWIFDLKDFSINVQELKLYLLGDGTDMYPGFFSPHASSSEIQQYFFLLMDTVFMAFMASFISIPIGFVLSIAMSRNVLDMLFFNRKYVKFFKPVLYYLASGISNIMRSVNELVWALILVVAVGLGPLAGVIALGIHSGGIMAKLLSERLEDINNDVCWHNLLDGSPVLHAFYCTILPQIKPHFISTILYRFETDVRSATVLGVVGAGGIGMYLKNALENFETQKASLIMLMIIVLIFAIDKLSAYLRKRFL